MTPTALLKLFTYIKSNPPSPSSPCIIFIIISFLISISLGQIVQTQNETATMDIYYASLDNAGDPGFRLGKIFCATGKDCIVYCDVSAGCSLTEIHGEDAKSLLIECNAVSACTNQFRVYGPTTPDTSEATIICNANTACNGPLAYLNLNNTAIVNVVCTGTPQATVGSCIELKIFVPSDVNNVNISCGPYDCNGMELWTKPSSLNAFLTCDGEESCTDAAIICVNGNGKSDLTWNLANTEWECSDQSCCPLIVDDVIIADNDNNVIDCSSIDCQNRYIEGSGLSLTVNCDAEDSCKYTKIICPPIAPCTVTCQGLRSCQDILIEASLSISLDLSCKAISACERADIYCSTDADSCDMECGGNDAACNEMQIFQTVDIDTSYFDITCPPVSFTDACSGIRFQCPSGDETMLKWAGTINSGGECIDSNSNCCPFGTPSVTTSAPTDATPPPFITEISTGAPSIKSIGDSTAPTITDAATGGDDGEGSSGELIYIIIGGFGVLALCVCFWGGFIYWQKRKNAGYGNEGGRGSKSSRNNGHTTNGGGNYNTNANIHDTGSQTNPGAYANHPGNGTPMMGNNLSDKPHHLEIEKSMEMPSTTQASITEPTATHATITAYNNHNMRKMGAGATITAYSRNVSNAPPPSLGLADLGTASGWE